MRIFRLFLLLLLPALPLGSAAQGNFEAFKKKHTEQFERFRNKKQQEFNEFRKRVNDEYAAMLCRNWEQFEAFRGIEKPKEEPVPPVVLPKDEPQPTPEPKPLPHEEVAPAPAPKPQPEPVVPIEEPKPEPKPKPKPTPKPVVKPAPTASFTFFGTQATVRFDASASVKVPGTGEKDIAQAWKAFSAENYTLLLADCLRLRKEHRLCDWAYLEMLHALSETLAGKGSNNATLLMAWLYCQSGYQMRLGRAGNKLVMLYASDHVVYSKPYYTLDNVMYYAFGDTPQQLNISASAFPKESAMSLYVTTEPVLTKRTSPQRTRQSERYPDVKVTMTSNLNLMDFYSTYPTSRLGDNVMTRWAMYAETPMSDDVKQQIYPALRQAVAGCSQLKAANKLLNWVQTGFEYEYDDKVWGGDRAFFAEESLYYPYCDCEDRAILFTRLVRDLLGLDCLLVYYPGHLASAVAFTESGVSGDYITVGGTRYTVCDPTFINAGVGRTMTGMDNKVAKVIRLKK